MARSGTRATPKSSRKDKSGVPREAAAALESVDGNEGPSDLKKALSLLADLAKGQADLAKGQAALAQRVDSLEVPGQGARKAEPSRGTFAGLLKERVAGSGFDFGSDSHRGSADRDESSSSFASGSGSSQRPRRRRRGRKSRKAQQAFRDSFKKLDFALKDPKPLLERAGQQLTEYDDWPLVGRAAQRVAPLVVPQLYQSHRRAVDWADQWVSRKFLTGKKDGEAMRRHCYSIDLALLYDFPKSNFQANPLNLAQIEVLSRDVYGLYHCYKLVQKESDLRSSGKTKAKTRYQLRADFDVVLMNDSTGLELVAPDADEHAARQRKFDLAADRVSASEVPDE